MIIPLLGQTIVVCWRLCTGKIAEPLQNKQIVQKMCFFIQQKRCLNLFSYIKSQTTTYGQFLSLFVCNFSKFTFWWFCLNTEANLYRFYSNYLFAIVKGFRVAGIGIWMTINYLNNMSRPKRLVLIIYNLV